MEGYTEVSREALREKIENREENLTLIDVRGRTDYNKSHLPDAINIPLDDIDLLVPRLVPNKWEDLVVYSDVLTCDLSEKAARVLVSLGYKDVKRYIGGIADWIGAGLPVEGDEYRGKVA